jgi:hypothetical protein
MSENEANNRSFLNPEDVLGDPRDSFELWAQTAKNAAPFSTLSNPGYRKAIVLEKVEEMSAAEAEGVGLGPPNRRMTSYKYMVRLCDEWNEHQLLPQPCDPATSTALNADLGVSHLMVVGSHDTQFGNRLQINVGDYVYIDMEKGTFMKNLQRASHRSMSNRNTNKRSHGFACLTNRNLAKNFAGMKTAPVITQQQEDFKKALEDKSKMPLSVTSYTRNAQQQLTAMDNNAKRRIDSLDQYGTASTTGQAAVLLKKRHNAVDEADKEAFYAQALALLESIPPEKLGGHMAGRAIDVPTAGMKVEDVDKLRLAIKELGGIVNLEPPKSKCWNQQGYNVHRDQYGKGTLKRLGNTGTGICAGEHICVTWPAEWTAPASTT